MKFVQKCRLAELDYDAREYIAMINNYFDDNLGYKTKQKIYCPTCLFQRKKEINNLSKQKKRKLHKI